eukprot:2884462-Pleurochrysis_carterae.AAC.3
MRLQCTRPIEPKFAGSADSDIEGVELGGLRGVHKQISIHSPPPPPPPPPPKQLPCRSVRVATIPQIILRCAGCKYIVTGRVGYSGYLMNRGFVHSAQAEKSWMHRNKVQVARNMFMTKLKSRRMERTHPNAVECPHKVRKCLSLSILHPAPHVEQVLGASLAPPGAPSHVSGA